MQNLLQYSTIIRGSKGTTYCSIKDTPHLIILSTQRQHYFVDGVHFTLIAHKIVQYQTTPLPLEVYSTPPRESRDPNQPIANFRCISVAPEEATKITFSDNRIHGTTAWKYEMSPPRGNNRFVKCRLQLEASRMVEFRLGLGQGILWRSPNENLHRSVDNDVEMSTLRTCVLNN
ncbi:hypothetical protein WN51_11263 [Melipona quadrifasciata]|uniref:Uncharacterized protein n=1 Tax=Melipona quadrifasciata TaxID=166423 RepID=A0A0M9A642_9HYME|nr:hypothetical protein WN51_11263 [Melipona quadrifasciata]